MPRNRGELVEQWTAAHGLTGSSPKDVGTNEILRREIYADADGTVKVESVLVKGLATHFRSKLAALRPVAAPVIFSSMRRSAAQGKLHNSGA